MCNSGTMVHVQGGWVYWWPSRHDAVWGSVLQSQSSGVLPGHPQSLSPSWQCTASPQMYHIRSLCSFISM